MKTDDLIALLARDGGGANPKAMRRLAAAAVGGLGLAVILMLAFLHIRPDIGAALWPVLLKALFGGALAAIAAPLVLRLGHPGRPWLGAARLLAGALALAVAAGLIALIGAAPGARMKALMGTGVPWCLVLIPLLAAPTAVLVILALRALAPTRLAAAGAAVGALSGGVGAMVYAMYCPVDQVAFVTIWYALAIGLCAALGAVLGARFLRW